jgi:hypothetical protein
MDTLRTEHYKTKCRLNRIFSNISFKTFIRIKLFLKESISFPSYGKYFETRRVKLLSAWCWVKADGCVAGSRDTEEHDINY